MYSIWVEVRDSGLVYNSDSTVVLTEFGTVIARTSAMLHADGTAKVTLPGSINGKSYYIAIFHQSAIQTWSANPIVFGATNTYDFSDNPAKAFGGNEVLTSSGAYAFFSGDINQDQNIDLSDYPSWDSDNFNFVFGYYSTDLNGDVNIDLSDFPFWDGNNTNFIFSNHP